MNTYMNEKIVQTVKAKMKADGISQQALANRLGMERTNLVRLVNGHVGSVPRRWQEVLDELGLELIAVPKEDEQPHA
jgi:transcriptional regulator with XRE-family HTH domain